MRMVIVSRHAAAVEFIRATAPEFAAAPVLAEATPDDVRGAVVAGNLPLHLAALCPQVVAVEFDGPPPRGADLTADQMRAAGARLARYTVAAAPEPPRTVKWSDKRRSRGRGSELIVGKGDVLVLFAGQHIPGVAAVVRADYKKNGKWSGTDYTIELARGAWSHEAAQSWEEGEYFHGCRSVADMVAVLRAGGFAGPAGAAENFFADAFPKTVARVLAVEAAAASLG